MSGSERYGMDVLNDLERQLEMEDGLEDQLKMAMAALIDQQSVNTNLRSQIQTLLDKFHDLEVKLFGYRNHTNGQAPLINTYLWMADMGQQFHTYAKPIVDELNIFV